MSLSLLAIFADPSFIGPLYTINSLSALVAYEKTAPVRVSRLVFPSTHLAEAERANELIDVLTLIRLDMSLPYGLAAYLASPHMEDSYLVSITSVG